MEDELGPASVSRGDHVCRQWTAPDALAHNGDACMLRHDIIPTPPGQNVASTLLVWVVETFRNDATVADVCCSCNLRKFVQELFFSTPYTMLPLNMSVDSEGYIQMNMLILLNEDESH